MIIPLHIFTNLCIALEPHSSFPCSAITLDRSFCFNYGRLSLLNINHPSNDVNICPLALASSLLTLFSGSASGEGYMSIVY